MENKDKFLYQKACWVENLLNSSSNQFDKAGHGTHTSSTIAGNFTIDADVFGNANGTTTGMVPSSHCHVQGVNRIWLSK